MNKIALFSTNLFKSMMNPSTNAISCKCLAAASASTEEKVKAWGNNLRTLLLVESCIAKNEDFEVVNKMGLLVVAMRLFTAE